MSGSEQSTKPNFQVDKHIARQYDEFVRLSRLYRNLVQELMERVRITKGDKVLCLASGTGLDARAASEAGADSVFGVDRSLPMVVVAREMSDADINLHFVQADAAAIPFPKEHFDVVLINAAGEYLWDNIYPIFVEVQRVLIPEGVFAFNCQSDEIESLHPEDPQRQLRRFVYLLGQTRGYTVRFSAKPTANFFSQLAQETGLTMLESVLVRITTNMDDALQQLLLPQFHVPFLGNVSKDKRDELLRDAVNILRSKKHAVDNYRYWHFFVFKKRA